MDVLHFFSNENALQDAIYVQLDESNVNMSSLMPANPFCASQDPEPLPHEWFQNLLDQHEEYVQELLDADPAFDEDSNPVPCLESLTYESNACEDQDRSFGWTREDNKKLADVILELKNQQGEVCPVSWRTITRHFNKRFDQNRTKTQLYSHFRYASRCQRMPCYLKAEEELILAFDEIGLPPGSAAPFLKTPRSSKLLELKLQRLKAAGRAVVPKDCKRANFRKRVQQILQGNWDRAAYENCRPPKNIVECIQHLIGNNSNLDRKYLTVKQAGRPKKETKVVAVTRQLKTLFKPFVYINKRRRRTTCLPGDGRSYGMTMFCLNRLLGSPLELDKMPIQYEDAVELGIEKCDVAIYSVLRDFLSVHAAKRPRDESNDESSSRPFSLPPELGEMNYEKPEGSLSDRNNYYSRQGIPPPESVLPPTLYTTTGVRGLLLYCDTLESIVNEDLDEASVLKETSILGNEESDAKIEQFLFSVFNMPLKLVQLPMGGEDNSDGDSDSDDDICYKNPAQFMGTTQVQSEPQSVLHQVVSVQEAMQADPLNIKTDDMVHDEIASELVAMMSEFDSFENVIVDENRQVQNSVEWAPEVSLSHEWEFTQALDDILNGKDRQIDFADVMQNSFSSSMF